ncbi:hypothetical protein H8L49_16220 [Klebsiella quasipneumoniae]|uniref:hypothetical protein n=1 Tax=Enterobacteriaceae TaxID=543 RepID=UPI0011CE2226|nr:MULTISPECIES: hypothetical protein [Enterobacteriaceae]EKW7174657.1 hypothetical protein [Enterobacter hormaechei]HAV1917382.1 hypothetical protein [Enterobacter hormaechei subsp. steigerwaltii]EKW7270765.1 hypothetical protein [Enterobacter hormaechei]MBC4811376.1 hypothetical protein [Klebsiella quasipneumoniae]MBE8730149.1 hypothetical protein [Citrobacter freundii]
MSASLLFRLFFALAIIAGFSSNVVAMTVNDFISYKAMLMSANDPASPLTQEERAKIHVLEKMSNQNLSGIVDGAISLNDLSTLKGRSKIICYPAGEQLNVQKFSDDLADYYDHIEPSKKAILASQRLGYFATAFLIKSYPCQ